MPSPLPETLIYHPLPDTLLFGELRAVIQDYDWNSTENNVREYEQYLRALAAVVEDSSKTTLSWPLLVNILKTAEFAQPLAYDTAWEEIRVADLEEAFQNDEPLTATQLFLRGLVVESRRRKDEYEIAWAKARAKNPKIPYILMNPHDEFAVWNNSGIYDVVEQYGSYRKDASKMVKDSLSHDERIDRIVLGPQELRWTFIVDLLSMGMSYE